MRRPNPLILLAALAAPLAAGAGCSMEELNGLVDKGRSFLADNEELAKSFADLTGNDDMAKAVDGAGDALDKAQVAGGAAASLQDGDITALVKTMSDGVAGDLTGPGADTRRFYDSAKRDLLAAGHNEEDAGKRATLAALQYAQREYAAAGPEDRIAAMKGIPGVDLYLKNMGIN